MRAPVSCPYCGEENSILIDETGGSLQRYVEDCQVCCQPWDVTVRVGSEIDVHLQTHDE